jgi:hypothetical protein
LARVVGTVKGNIMLLGTGNNMEALEILVNQWTFFSLKKKKKKKKPTWNQLPMHIGLSFIFITPNSEFSPIQPHLYSDTSSFLSQNKNPEKINHRSFP